MAWALLASVWATVRADSNAPRPVRLPLLFKLDPCAVPTGESFGVLDVIPPPTDRPAEQHADLNLALRGYVPVAAHRGLVDYGGGADPHAPQLAGLFADERTPVVSSVHQVYDWNWDCNCRGGVIANPQVTLIGLASSQGEVVRVPGAGYTIGSGYQVLMLYASAERITLKYTREDNVVSGYTLHVEDICVDANLLALYRTQNSAGRSFLPALRAGQSFGRARSGEVRVAIRDHGSFMDPRSRKDWWQGR